MDISTFNFDKMCLPFPDRGPIIESRIIQAEDGTKRKESTIQLAGAIGPSTSFSEVFQLLFLANQGDKVTIFIDTPGGNVFTTQLLTDAMDRCKGDVITNATGLVASAGTVIFDHGKEKIVGPFAKFMYHGTSHSAAGNSTHIMIEAKLMLEFFQTILTDFRERGILTEEEFNRIVSQQDDVYITADEMRKRLDAGSSATTDPDLTLDTTAPANVETDQTAPKPAEEAPVEPKPTEEKAEPKEGEAATESMHAGAELEEEPLEEPEEEDGTPPDEAYYTEGDEDEEFEDPSKINFDAE